MNWRVPKAMEESLQYLSQNQDLMDLHDFVGEEDLGQAMNRALRMVAREDVPPAAKAAELVVKFQAYSFKFAMLAQTYMTIKQGKAGTDENKKKNVYFAMSEQCAKLSDALKIIARYGS